MKGSTVATRWTKTTTSGIKTGPRGKAATTESATSAKVNLKQKVKQ